MDHYTRLFTKHFWDFFTQNQLTPTSGRAVLAVSAGMDSMVLMELFHRFAENFKEVKVVHIHHGTRAENDQELELVREQAGKYGFGFKAFYWRDNSDSGNFEKRARDFRYQKFNEELLPGDRLYTAHHIDDSFEWSLLQSFKTGTETLGIPLVSGSVARPLHCVTRKQIANYAKLNRIRFCEDPSNRDLGFQRNYIRHQVIPHIASAFPHYLRFYTHRMNARSGVLGVDHLGMLERCSKLQVRHLPGPAIEIIGESSITELKKALIQGICELSAAGRGSLQEEVQKFVSSLGRGSRGPHNFSGEVEAYALEKCILLIGRAGKADFLQRIRSFSEVRPKYRSWSLSEYQSSLQSVSNNPSLFPYWVFVDPREVEKFRLKTWRKDHPLWSEALKLWKSQKLAVLPASALLKYWQSSHYLEQKPLSISPLF